MTLDALFAAADAAPPPSDGPLIPVADMPLGAFREMVERHLGRELTDDNGRDLAGWLDEATATLDPSLMTDASVGSSMAHLLVGMAREHAAGDTGAAAAGEAEGVDDAARPTLGSRIAAIARSIGLPVGTRGDGATSEGDGTTEGPSDTIDGAAEPGQIEPMPVVRKPFVRPRISRAARQVALHGAQPAPTPVVIDLRGPDPFATAEPGGGRLSPFDAAVSGTVFSVELMEGSPTPTDTGAARSMDTGAAVDGPSTPVSLTASPQLEGAGPTSDVAQSRSGAAASTGMPEPRLEGAEPTRDVAPTFEVDPQVIDATQIDGRTESRVEIGARTSQPAPPVRIPMSAVQRIMRIVDLQASAPPPRMAVVEIPELGGLRVMVSVGEGGTVSVTPLGGSTDAIHAPFIQTVSETLESQGFLLDERSRGRGQHRERPETGDHSRRDQRRPRQRPDGLFA